MRVFLLTLASLAALAVAACSSAPVELVVVVADASPDRAAVSTPDAGAIEEGGHVDADAGAPVEQDAGQLVKVAFTWAYAESHGDPCVGAMEVSKEPVCPRDPGTMRCPVAAPIGQQRYTWLLGKCCTAWKSIREAKLPRLAADYPGCALVRTGETATLTCPLSGVVYLALDGSRTLGQPWPHVVDVDCAWAPPYAEPQ